MPNSEIDIGEAAQVLLSVERPVLRRGGLDGLRLARKDQSGEPALDAAGRSDLLGAATCAHAADVASEKGHFFRESLKLSSAVMNAHMGQYFGLLTSE